MNLKITILVFAAFAFLGGVDARHQPSPNQINRTTPFPVNHRDSQFLGESTPPSQSNQTPSFPANPIQQGQLSNPSPPLGHPPPPGQNNLNPQVTVMIPPSLGDSTPPSQSNQICSSTADPFQQEELTNPILPFPVRDPWSPSHQTQPEHHSNRIPPSQSPGQNNLNPQVTVMIPPSLGDSTPPSQNNLNPQVTVMIPPSLDHALIQRNLSTPQSQSSNHSPPPVYERAPSQTFQPSVQYPNNPLVPPSPPVMVPRYRENEFVAIESAHQHGPLPHEFHRMDPLSFIVLSYCLAFGVGYTSTWAQRPNLSTSIHIQCFLNQAAFSLFLLANAVFARTHPVLAFVLDRLSFYLIVPSAYLASMPMFPPYFAIIMFLFVMIVYIFFRLRV